MDVSTLVTQMHETLSTIHRILASLDTASHDARLDEIERQRDSALASLRHVFQDEADSILHKRKAELDEIAENRRREDEERERRRQLEDEELAERNQKEDHERQLRLDKDTHDVEEETDALMNEVEEDAARLLEEGKERLRPLEERRKEINCLIDEQLKTPLPRVPSRRKTMCSSSTAALPMVAAESKIPAPNLADELPGNLAFKAHEEHNLRTSSNMQTMPQVLNIAEFSRILVPEPHLHRNTEPESFNGGDISHGPPWTAGPEEANVAALQGAHFVSGDSQDTLMPKAPGPHQGGSTIASSTQYARALETDDLAVKCQAINTYETKDDEDTGNSGSSTQSTLESRGRTATTPVGGQPASSSKRMAALPLGDSLQQEQAHQEGKPSTPGNSPLDKQKITPQGPELGITGQVGENEAIMTPAPNDDLDPERPISSEASDAGEPNEPGLGRLLNQYKHESDLVQDAISRGSSPSGREGDHGFAIKADIENLPPDSAYSDERHAMAGHEPIPGTITHGSEDRSSQVIEPIPGTMTHDIDHPTTKLPEAGAISRSSRSTSYRNKDGTEALKSTTKAPSSRKSPLPDKQVVLHDSKMGRSQLEAILLRCSSLEQDTAPLPLASSVVMGDHIQDFCRSPKEEYRQPNPEDGLPKRSNSIEYPKVKIDVAGNEDSWSGVEGQFALYPPNTSTEGRSAAGRSIVSLLPTGVRTASTEDGLCLDNVADHSYDTEEVGSSFDHTGHIDAANPPEIAMTSECLADGEVGDTLEHGPRCLDGVKGELCRPDADDIPETCGNSTSTHPCDVQMSPADTTIVVKNDVPHLNDDISERDVAEVQGPSLLVDPAESRKLNAVDTDPEESHAGFVSGNSNPHTESQMLVAPLAPALFHTPTQFQEWSADNRISQSGDGSSRYGLGDQDTTTVHGQDNLFNDDGRPSEDGFQEHASGRASRSSEEANHRDTATTVREQFTDSAFDGDDRGPATAVLVDEEVGASQSHTSNNTVDSHSTHQLKKQPEGPNTGPTEQAQTYTTTTLASPVNAGTNANPRPQCDAE